MKKKKGKKKRKNEESNIYHLLIIQIIEFKKDGIGEVPILKIGKLGIEYVTQGWGAAAQGAVGVVVDIYKVVHSHHFSQRIIFNKMAVSFHSVLVGRMHVCAGV